MAAETVMPFASTGVQKDKGKARDAGRHRLDANEQEL